MLASFIPLKEHQILGKLCLKKLKDKNFEVKMQISI